jgi:hypothetical protein
MRVTQVGGMTVVGMSEEQEAFMQKRVLSDRVAPIRRR